MMSMVNMLRELQSKSGDELRKVTYPPSPSLNVRGVCWRRSMRCLPMSLGGFSRRAEMICQGCAINTR